MFLCGEQEMYNFVNWCIVMLYIEATFNVMSALDVGFKEQLSWIVIFYTRRR